MRKPLLVVPSSTAMGSNVNNLFCCAYDQDSDLGESRLLIPKGSPGVVGEQWRQVQCVSKPLGMKSKSEFN